MSNVIKPGTRVDTKFGWGTIVDFERITHVNSPIEYVSDYQDGDRIGVKLDNPSNWICSNGQNIPYFLLSDLLDWEF